MPADIAVLPYAFFADLVKIFQKKVKILGWVSKEGGGKDHYTMNKHKTNSLPAVCAGLLAVSLSVGADVLPLATPPSSAFADTESSTNISLLAWRAYTRPVTVTVSLNATPTNALQIAFGHDRNGNGDLAPEETEYVIGCDCGEWFERSEGLRGVARTPSHPPRATPLNSRWRRKREHGGILRK